jgi:hypothetical protein
MHKRFVFDHYTLTALALRGRMPGRFFVTSSTDLTAVFQDGQRSKITVDGLGGEGLYLDGVDLYDGDKCVARGAFGIVYTKRVEGAHEWMTMLPHIEDNPTERALVMAEAVIAAIHTAAHRRAGTQFGVERGVVAAAARRLIAEGANPTHVRADLVAGALRFTAPEPA